MRLEFEIRGLSPADLGVNQAYRARALRVKGSRPPKYRGHLYSTKRFDAAKAEVTKRARQAHGGRAPIPGPCAIMISIRFEGQQGDDDGPLKAIRDAVADAGVLEGRGDEAFRESHIRRLPPGPDLIRVLVIGPMAPLDTGA